MNPELLRNLWLTITPLKLILMPVVLAIIFFLMSNNGLADFALTVSFIILILWGLPVAQSIVNERKAHTWDQQRMSALSPWSMLWGKILGCSAYGWYGCILSLLVFCTASYMDGAALETTAFTIIEMICYAIFIILVSMLMCSWFMGGYSYSIVILLPVFFLYPYVLGSPGLKTILWWSSPFSLRTFILGSIIFFSACTLFALWRLMCFEMRAQKLPWAYPLFAVLLGCYIAGFAEMPAQAAVWLIGVTALIMTYCALLLAFTPSETAWHRVFHYYHNQQYRHMLYSLPLWPLTLILAILCIPVAFLIAPESAVFGFKPSWPPALVLFVATMITIRDVFVFLFFVLARSHSGKSTALMLLLYISIVHLLFPLLSQASKTTQILATFFQPLIGGHIALSIAVGFTHIMLALGLLLWRIREIRKRSFV